MARIASPVKGLGDARLAVSAPVAGGYCAHQNCDWYFHAAIVPIIREHAIRVWPEVFRKNRRETGRQSEGRRKMSGKYPKSDWKAISASTRCESSL
jgi:hypothetical protein